MRVIVFNVAAQTGGAMTILKEYYDEALINIEDEWHFILSTPELKDDNNVYIHNYPWVKKSWFHRLFFDIFVANRIVKNLNGDVTLSLQNTLIPFVKTNQVVYFHQVLPFSEKRYGLIENPLFWVYQNIISRIIIYSVKKSHKLIVQSKWIKDMFVKKYNINADKIVVKPPTIEIKAPKKCKTANHNGITTYFYPSSSGIYKNHRLIVDAVQKLVEEGIKNFEVKFTLSGGENTEIKKLKEIIVEKNLPISFIGKLSKLQVYDLYSKSILIFPSYIETVGLPLIEAKLHDTPIIVSNLEYSKQTLEDYNNVHYINPYDADSLYQIIKKYQLSKE